MYQGTEKDWCANLESAIKALSAGNLFIFDTGTLNVSNSVIVQIRLLFVMKKQGYIFLSGCCFQIFKLGPYFPCVLTQLAEQNLVWTKWQKGGAEKLRKGKET